MRLDMTGTHEPVKTVLSNSGPYSNGGIDLEGSNASLEHVNGMWSH